MGIEAPFTICHLGFRSVLGLNSLQTHAPDTCPGSVGIPVNCGSHQGRHEWELLSKQRHSYMCVLLYQSFPLAFWAEGSFFKGKEFPQLWQDDLPPEKAAFLQSQHLQLSELGKIREEHKFSFCPCTAPSTMLYLKPVFSSGEIHQEKYWAESTPTGLEPE